LRDVRLLNWLTALLLGLALVVISTGGFTLPLGRVRLPVNRVEDVFLAALAVAFLRHWLHPFSFPRVIPRRALVWGVVLYSALFSFITVTRHFAFRTHALDLGIYDQITWSISQGLGPMTSLPEMHAWGDHFTIILYLLAPLYVVMPSVLVMLVVQSVALSLGAMAVYGFARRALGDNAQAAAFALLFLVNPSLHGINLRDFHPQALAIPLLLAAVYFFEARRPALFWISVALSLATREDAALPLLGLALWAALARRRYWTGVALGTVALVWLFMTTTLIIPYFRGAPYPHLGRYGYLGDSVGEIVLGILLHPLAALGTAFSPSRLLYLGAILAPFAFLPLLAPLSLIPALPALAQNLLSIDPVLFHHRSQYNVFILPFLALAAVSGFSRLSSLKGAAVARTLLVCAFFFSLALTSRTLNDLMVTRWWPGERERAAHAVLARVPPLASISADERFVPHLSHRPKAFIFPTALDRSEYVLINTGAYPWRNLPDHRLERQGNTATVREATTGVEYRYEVLTEQARILLLKKVW
jgi:uncharacterized membrane protein